MFSTMLMPQNLKMILPLVKSTDASKQYCFKKDASKILQIRFDALKQC